MRTIAAETKTDLLPLLDDVAAGGSVTITRNGRPVAALTAIDTELPSEEPDRTTVERLRRGGIVSLGRPFDWEEIKALRDEGRR